MNFTKIKYRAPTEKKGPQVTLKYAEATASGKTEKHKLTCDEAPRPELVKALQAFRPVVMEACMLPEYDIDGTHLPERLTIRSVTIKRDDAGRSIVITALRTLDWIDNDLVINTPLAGELLIPAERVPGEVPELLDQLEEEARRYAEGERAQQELFSEAVEEARGRFEKSVSNIEGVDKVEIMHHPSGEKATMTA